LTDACAELFLRKYNGFNFMLNRLFNEPPNRSKSYRQFTEANLELSVSSDECPEDMKAQGKSKSVFSKKLNRRHTGLLIDKKESIQQPILRKQSGEI
jgi:hypothetical protein